MKCAKCGCDIPESAAQCPGCAAGYDASTPGNEQVRCPVCGSPEISAVQSTYNPGCGCLGMLIFGWIGLLLGLLGAGKVELVCRHCGAVWKAGKPGSVRRRGCGMLIFLILLIILLIYAM